MTEDEQQLLKVGAESAIKPFANLIERLFGGPVDQVGGMLEDGLKVRRILRQIKLYKKLQKKIEEGGFDPQQIPDAIWVPSLQLASLEDNETLQEIWANLLANAADPRHINPVAPSFIGILRELSGREVKFLDTLFAQQNGVYGLIFSEGDLAHLYIKAGLARYVTFPNDNGKTFGPRKSVEILGDENDADFQLIMDLLERERILIKVSEPGIISDRDIRDIAQHVYDTEPLRVSVDEYFIFTQLGRAFVRACQSPTA